MRITRIGTRKNSSTGRTEMLFPAVAAGRRCREHFLGNVLSRNQGKSHPTLAEERKYARARTKDLAICSFQKPRSFPAETIGHDGHAAKSPDDGERLAGALSERGEEAS